MGHDTAARSEFVRKADKIKILAHIEAAVHGEPC